jgi:flagellar assembly factor FliW
MPAIFDNKANDMETRQYLSNLEDIQKYIDTRLDIFEHKFLVFACNIGETHWVSTVVVNPFLLFERYLAKGKEDDGGQKCSVG